MAKKKLIKSKSKIKGNNFYFIGVIAIFVVLGVYMTARSIDSNNSIVGNTKTGKNIKLIETGSVMASSLWSGSVAKAYEIAARIPEVIDAQYCNCDCSINPRFNHKTLLTCFTNDHGAHCGICMNEVFLAGELHEKGLSIPDIKTEVDKKFSR